MYCQSCGKDMGNHTYHSKGTCNECKKSFGILKWKINKTNRIEVDERSRTWKVI